MGSHGELDAKLNIDKSRYAASFVQSFVNFDGYVVIDINAKAITKVLNEIELDDGIVIGYIAPDGTEILNTVEQTTVFSGQDFFQTAVSSGETHAAMITYEGQNYLFVYTPISDTGSSVACLVPEKVMLRQAYEIRNMTISITIAAIVIALFIALFLALSMHKAIRQIVVVLEKAAEGDLTGSVFMKRKDEFGVLGHSINGMITNMKGLLYQVNQTSGLVESSSDDVAQTSAMLVASSDEICKAIADIEMGASSQAGEAEKCLEQMAGLSDKINVLSVNTNAIETISHDTKNYVN